METINPKVSAFVRAGKEDPDRFWAQAATALPWHRRWDRVLDWDPEHPEERGRYVRWFIGGETNVAYSADDRHVEAGNRDGGARVGEDACWARTVLADAEQDKDLPRMAPADRV